MNFDYDEFTTRNIGFVTKEQQEKLKATRVFIAGVGGMGGAALMTLVRLGVETFTLVDIDTFEVSNLNRQVFADLPSMDKSKLETTIKKCLEINPNLKITRARENWTEDLDQILKNVDIAVNGCDDVRASIALMRKAKEIKVTVVDAYASLFPNVYTVAPEDPRPEEFLNYPSVNKDLDEITQEDVEKCFMREIEFVLTHTTNAKYIDVQIANDIANGKIKRISFATMVIGTGTLMANEVVRSVLKINNKSNTRGFFLNPWTFKVERPRPLWAIFIKRHFVRRFLYK